MQPGRVLLVEPQFPIPPKSRNHHNFLPVGLLKLASLLRARSVEVRLVRGVPSSPQEISDLKSFDPDEIWMTTLFTYWASHVKTTVEAYRRVLPNARVILGGIYASLLPAQEVISYTGCDEVRQGVVDDAEALAPAYDLLEDYTGTTLDYQIVHASRGCPRKCRFCGTWKVEPSFRPEASIADRVVKKHLVFYDNNLLMNPHIDAILGELAILRKSRRLSWCESQSGFDGRVLAERPELAKMLRAAGFRNPRIAWDHGVQEQDAVRKQLALLQHAGYAPSKQIYVFMVFNWDIPFAEMEAKRIRCWEWKVQIADCRYRPLDQLYDNYRGGAVQGTGDYHIHTAAGWTDRLVKQFRRNVREQNICVRHGFPFYSRSLERKQYRVDPSLEERRAAPLERQLAELARIGADYWVPSAPRWPAEVQDAALFSRASS